MSVILTACRHNKQKSIARALKKRAEKQKRKEAELALANLEAEEDLANFVKLWSFMIEGEQFTVMLYLASHKDTVDIFCNEEEVTNVITNVNSDGATFEFVVGGSYKARISCRGNPFEGLVHQLTVNEYLVPEVKT